MPKTKVRIHALTDVQQATLTAMAQSSSVPAAVALRARIVLASENLEEIKIVSKDLGIHRSTVAKWRMRFALQGTAGLYDAARSGRPRKVNGDRVSDLHETALGREPPPGAAAWSIRLLADETRIDKSSVHRYLQPLSPGPSAKSIESLSDRRVREVMGLCLQPPDNALVLCTDARGAGGRRSGSAARPSVAGYLDRGADEIIAAISTVRPAKSYQDSDEHVDEFLDFLRVIEHTSPPGTELHLLTSNWFSHRHPRIRAWLTRRPNWHLYAVPTHTEWLRHVERFLFAALYLARPSASHARARALVKVIDRFVRTHTDSRGTFMWWADGP